MHNIRICFVLDLRFLECDAVYLTCFNRQRTRRMVSLASFSQFAAFGREFAKLRHRCLTVTRVDSLADLVAHEKVQIARLLECSNAGQALTQFLRHWSKHTPGVAEHEGDFFTQMVVLPRQPKAESELPIREISQYFTDLAELLLPRCLCAQLLTLRMVVGIGHHRLQRGEHRGRIFRLRRLKEVHAVTLMPVRVQVFVDQLQCGMSMLALLQGIKQKAHGCRLHYKRQFVIRANGLRDFEQQPIRLHRFRFDARQELSADEVVIWQRFS